MKKNVASQVIGAEMINATTGAAFTSTVTVYVTGDAGTQAIGSVGSGICTHEGNGFHTYAPAQAETNYDHVAFTFIGTGAIPATVQLYTDFPQTGDAFARIGAPAGASASADIAAVKVDTAAVKVKTDFLPSAAAGAAGGVFIAGTNAATAITTALTTTFTGNLTGSVNSVTTGVTLAASAVQAIWDALTSALTTVGSIGKLIVDNLNATISSRSTYAGGAVASVTADVGITQAAADKVFGSGGAAMAELAQGIPAATPSPGSAIMALYMALRNKLDVTATTKSVTNDAGTVIFKKALSDDGTTYSEAEAVSGP